MASAVFFSKINILADTVIAGQTVAAVVNP